MWAGAQARAASQSLLRVATLVVAGLGAVASASCGTSGAGTSAGRPSSTTSQVGATASFRGVGTLSLESSVPFPAVRMHASGTPDDYLLSARVAAQSSRSCFSSGGWRERVPAAGGGTTTLDLTRPDRRKCWRRSWRNVPASCSASPASVVRPLPCRRRGERRSRCRRHSSWRSPPRSRRHLCATAPAEPPGGPPKRRAVRCA
jgi:hypothetical protein